MINQVLKSLYEAFSIFSPLKIFAALREISIGRDYFISFVNLYHSVNICQKQLGLNVLWGNAGEEMGGSAHKNLVTLKILNLNEVLSSFP